MTLNRTQKHEALKLHAQWRDENVPSVITGFEAASLAQQILGFIPVGLVRNSRSHFKAVSLAKTAACVAAAR